MRKPSTFVVLALAVVAGASQLGCRACQNCLDYGPPVAGYSCEGGCAPNSHAVTRVGSANASTPRVAERVIEPLPPTH